MALRITIEMLPKGDDTQTYILAQGVIANDGTGDLATGNYIYGFSGQTKRPGHDPGIRTSGRLEGFSRRRHDAWELLRRCLNQGDENLVESSGTGFVGERDGESA